MEENQYVIISKIAILKRIEELEKQRDEYSFNPNRTEDYYRYNSIIKVLKEILSQSTPLIPEIEKALNYVAPIHARMDYQTHCKLKQDYISNLKLDI